MSYHTVDESACYRAPGAPVGAMKLLQQLLHCVPVRHFSTPTRFGSKMGFW